jgi:hypothetical protein
MPDAGFTFRVRAVGGERSAATVLVVLARPSPALPNQGARTPRTKWLARGTTGARKITPRRGLMQRNYPSRLTWQNPCASIPSAVLNLLRKFSSAMAAVSSTTSASVK